MEEGHPVIQGYAKLLDVLNQQLDSLLSGEAEQWETIKDQIDYLCDLLERDGLVDDVLEVMEQIAAFHPFFEDILGDMEADKDVSWIVYELRSTLSELQRKIAAVPQEKLEAAALAWKSREEQSGLDSLDPLSLRLLRNFKKLAESVRLWREADRVLGENLSKALESCTLTKNISSAHLELNSLLIAYSAALSSARGSIQQKSSLSLQEAEQLEQTLERLREQRYALDKALRQAKDVEPVRECFLGILEKLGSPLHNLEGSNLPLRRIAVQEIENISKAILEKSPQAPIGGSPFLSRLAQALDALRAFSSLTMQTIDNDTVLRLERLLEEYTDLTDLPLPPEEIELDWEAREIQHILVVEDDPGWQEFIKYTIQEVFPNLSDRIYVVGTYQEALLFLAVNLQNAGKITALGEKTRGIREQLGLNWPLSHTPGWKQRLQEPYPDWPLIQEGTILGTSCLCLLDLHIPRDAKAAESDQCELLGLDLLELMRYRRLNLRVIILTGARDHPGVARRAIERGCRYYDYLYKDALDCKEKLKQRLQEATMIPKEEHLIEVFSFTGDLVRIDGVDVTLERAPFKVFERLANSRAIPPDGFGVYALWSNIIADLSTPYGETIFDGVDAAKEKDEGKLNDHIDHIREAIHEALRETGRYIDTKNLVGYLDVIGEGEAKASRLRARAEDIKVYELFEDAQFAYQEPRILVVEDQPEWRKAIREALRAWQPYPIDFAQTYEEALEKAQSLRPNIAVLDMEIPRQDGRCHWEVGVELLRCLREELPNLQIIVFTAYEARDALREQVNALGVNIRDYISKKSEVGLYELPFAVLRRQRMLEQGSKMIPYRDFPPFYNLELNLSDRTLVIDYQSRVQLSPREALFLCILAERPPLQSVKRERITEKIWDHEDGPEDPEGALDSIKSRLCRRITEYTDGKIRGDKVILMSKGVYRLHGVARIKGPSRP